MRASGTRCCAAAADHSEWLAAYRAGKSIRRIARETGANRGRVARVLHRAGCVLRSRSEAVELSVSDLETVPGLAERMAAVYPDAERQDWIRKRMAAWEARHSEGG